MCLLQMFCKLQAVFVSATALVILSRSFSVAVSVALVIVVVVIPSGVAVPAVVVFTWVVF